MAKDPGRVLIFDTTLRDGEQSPGASLNLEEKLAIAQQLARLGVDVIEAGFPFASPGDFAAVQRIAQQVGGDNGPIICGLARASRAESRPVPMPLLRRPVAAFTRLSPPAISISSTSCAKAVPTCWASFPRWSAMPALWWKTLNSPVKTLDEAIRSFSTR